MTTTTAQLRFRAAAAIDRAAGDARLKYITDVPGQQAVYITKLEQARAYLAALEVDPGAAVPPYIAAEAAATGASAVEVASTVTGLAAQWNGVIGPAIEGARLGGKSAVALASGVDEASTQAAIEAALQAALEALAAM